MEKFWHFIYFVLESELDKPERMKVIIKLPEQ